METDQIQIGPFRAVCSSPGDREEGASQPIWTVSIANVFVKTMVGNRARVTARVQLLVDALLREGWTGEET